VHEIDSGSDSGSDSDLDNEHPQHRLSYSGKMVDGQQVEEGGNGNSADKQRLAGYLNRTASKTMQQLEELSGDHLAELRKFRKLNRTASGYYPMAPRGTANR